MFKKLPLFGIALCLVLTFLVQSSVSARQAEEENVKQHFFTVGDAILLNDLYLAHSYVGFVIKSYRSKVRGRFEKFSGAILFDKNDVTKTSTTFMIDTESVNSSSHWRDKDLRGPTWFHSEEYPMMKFQSKRSVKTSNGFNLIGDLTIRDKTKEMTLAMETPSVFGKSYLGTEYSFSGEVTVNRKDFGVGARTWWNNIAEGVAQLADEAIVELTINATLQTGKFRKSRLQGQIEEKVYKTFLSDSLESAVKEFERLKSDPENKVRASDLNEIGIALLRDGQIDEAFFFFKHNVKSFPEEASVYIHLGEAYYIFGDKSNAVKNYELALAKDPYNATAIEVLRHLNNK